MPQITVDYSPVLDPGFDREGFARALHAATVEIAAARPEACKTQFRRSDLTAYGYEDPGEQRHAVVHISIGLLPGRTDDTKARLTETTLDLLRKHLEGGDGVVLHASAEVLDLDASYRKSEGEL